MSGCDSFCFPALCPAAFGGFTYVRPLSLGVSSRSLGLRRVPSMARLTCPRWSQVWCGCENSSAVHPMRVDWCVPSWFRIKNTHSLTHRPLSPRVSTSGSGFPLAAQNAPSPLGAREGRSRAALLHAGQHVRGVTASTSVASSAAGSVEPPAASLAPAPSTLFLAASLPCVRSSGSTIYTHMDTTHTLTRRRHSGPLHAVLPSPLGPSSCSLPDGYTTR